jgi:peptidoglycan/LPS O-acetylase OafA/YrhL
MSARQIDARSERSPRRADIQGLRALAVLLVVAFHAGLPVPGGSYGVDVFFAISGFVITSLLATELAATGRLSLAHFYLRRVKRLLPALAVMLTFVALVGIVASPVGAQRIGALTGIWASLFGANLYLGHLTLGYFDVSASLNPLLHTWTLAVEEQFYLLFPVVLLIAWRTGRRRHARIARSLAVIAIAAVSVSSFLLMWETSAGSSFAGVGGSQFAFYSAPARAWEFGAGALLALALPLMRRLPMLLGSAFGALGLGLVVLSVAPTSYGDAGFRPTAAMLAIGGACALLAAGSAPANLVSRGLGTWPLVRIGDLSYSWYLWHWPLIVFARALWPSSGWVAVGAAGLSLLPAWLSYRFVENPIRFSPRIKGRVAFALATGCMAIPIAASGGLIATRGALERTQSLQSWNRVERRHADGLLGCNTAAPLGERPAGLCNWHVTHPRGTVVLVGDSNAGHFTEPFRRAARQAGYDAIVATLYSCPFVDLRVEPGIGSFNRTCGHFFDGTLATLVARRPSLVIMAARSDYYIEDAEVGLGAPGSEESFHTAAVKAPLWQEGVTSVLASLNQAGIPGIVVHPIPPLRTDSEGTALITILLRSNSASVARSGVDSRLLRSVSAEDQAVAGAQSASTLDFEDAVCGPERCSSNQGRRFLYRDSTHLSVDGALTLTGRFYAAISAHAEPRVT